MGIRQVTPDSAIKEATQKSIDNMLVSILRDLHYVGESAVNEARLSHSYKDQTGNLTSSMGYGVFKDGKLVDAGGFEPYMASDTGPDDGRKFLESLASEFPTGIVLVVVAGKHYSKYVAARGYNVLDSSERLARMLVEELFR